jgi:putative FmdB family regulatory protein
MPIYEYRCEKGHEFEVLQKISDDALDRCQECGAPAQRVLRAPAVHFKGSGFYTTDYGRRKSAPSDGGSSSDGDRGSSSGKASESSGSADKSAANSSTPKSGD